MGKTSLPRAARGRLWSASVFVLVDCFLALLAWSRWSQSPRPAAAVLGVSTVVGAALLVAVVVAFLGTVRSGPQWMSALAARRVTLVGRIIAALRMVGLIGALGVLATAAGGPDVSGLFLVTVGLVDAIMAVAFTTAIATELPEPTGRTGRARTARPVKRTKSPQNARRSETPAESEPQPQPETPSQATRAQKSPKKPPAAAAPKGTKGKKTPTTAKPSKKRPEAAERRTTAP